MYPGNNVIINTILALVRLRNSICSQFKAVPGGASFVSLSLSAARTEQGPNYRAHSAFFPTLVGERRNKIAVHPTDDMREKRRLACLSLTKQCKCLPKRLRESRLQAPSGPLARVSRNLIDTNMHFRVDFLPPPMANCSLF